ncbi:hypothetical protein [Magnetospira sp. QH-2]|uniref:hypothetical protein n=1 Tax=Magnetospira sp. (strain QH-2) TaxID=1288970 RepID=UPI0011DD24C7|nr:hypothetical protein [Magnetospira sp. QH-2]
MFDHAAKNLFITSRRTNGVKMDQWGQSKLITGHPCYDTLGHAGGQRRKAYQGLFKEGIPDRALEEIRLNTNKGWVLGGDRFKGEIKKMTDRRIEPIPRGGDLRSKKYREAANA